MNMDNIIRHAKFIKNNSSKFGRINKVYKYCEKHNIEKYINFILAYINDRILISI